VTQGEKGDTFYIVKSGKSCIRSKWQKAWSLCHVWTNLLSFIFKELG
jgi:hypothetical protein